MAASGICHCKLGNLTKECHLLVEKVTEVIEELCASCSLYQVRINIIWHMGNPLMFRVPQNAKSECYATSENILIFEGILG